MTERPATLELALHETFPASAEELYSLMTDPVQLVEWWGPQGFSTSVSEFAPVAGGAYRLTMQPPEGEAFHLSGEFLEADRPRRLAYTFRWEEPDPDDRDTVVVLTLRAVDGGTDVVLSQGPFTTEERLVLHRNGWTESFGKLRAIVGRTTA
jgi:uncharacterized protein YndB with AHSA1/START domain